MSDNDLRDESSPDDSGISRNVESLKDMPVGTVGSHPLSKNNLVYGNLDNLGITYGKTSERLMYTKSRKSTVLSDIENMLDNDSLLSPDDSKITPEDEPIKDTTKSHSKKVRLVYGNSDNLGITYGKTRDRLMYSTSRRNTAVLENILRLLTHTPNTRKSRNRTPIIAYLETRRDMSSRQSDGPTFLLKTRKRDKTDSETDSESDSSSSSSEYETSPDNPYTAHKDKYLQNYLWNHKMTGDHMNVNPNAPKFNAMGSFGPELMFSRKWWYFNQDDFVPFG